MLDFLPRARLSCPGYPHSSPKISRLSIAINGSLYCIQDPQRLSCAVYPAQRPLVMELPNLAKAAECGDGSPTGMFSELSIRRPGRARGLGRTISFQKMVVRGSIRRRNQYQGYLSLFYSCTHHCPINFGAFAYHSRERVTVDRPSTCTDKCVLLKGRGPPTATMQAHHFFTAG